jgi:hypothetical protein
MELGRCSNREIDLDVEWLVKDLLEPEGHTNLRSGSSDKLVLMDVATE